MKLITRVPKLVVCLSSFYWDTLLFMMKILINVRTSRNMHIIQVAATHGPYCILISLDYIHHSNGNDLHQGHNVTKIFFWQNKAQNIIFQNSIFMQTWMYTVNSEQKFQNKILFHKPIHNRGSIKP